MITPDQKNCGVVVALDRMNSTEDIAFTWAHEMGHYLGLFHTRELGMNIFDPLSDSSPDAMDMSNIMNSRTSRAGIALLHFSSQQGEVMKNHPIIY